MNLLDTLLSHNEGTTRRLVEQSAELTDEQLDQDFDLGLRSVRRSLDHIIENMEWWTDLMNGQPQRSFEALAHDPRSLAGLQCRLDTVSEELARIAHNVEHQGRWDEYWPDRADQRSRRYGATLVHVLTHGAHHRSQVIHMLRRLGVQDVIWGDALGF